MKKRGSTQSTTPKDKRATASKKTPKAAADTDGPTPDVAGGSMKTGGKRQLPLDFSRHAVKKTALEGDATNFTKDMRGAAFSTAPHHLYQQQQQQQQEYRRRSDFVSSAPTCMLDPPVIRVDLTSTRLQNQSTDTGTSSSVNKSAHSCIVETDAVAASISTKGLVAPNVECDPDQEDDDDDVDALLRSASRKQQCSRGVDCDSDMDMDGKKTETLLSAGAVLVKTEDDEGGHDPQLSYSGTTDDLLPHFKNDPDEEERKDLDILLPPKYRWKTVYVAAFELALDTVLPEEAFLFTDEEHSLFETYRALPDDPKHLFVRLFLRKQKYWQRQCKLEGQYRELEDLEVAIQQLIQVGLLMDQNAIHDPEEALVMLTMDELKTLARRIGMLEKLSGKQRPVLVETILEHFRQQSFISKRLLLVPRAMPNDDSADRGTGLATHTFLGDATKRNNALVDKIVDISGPCIKIYPNVMNVFERLHLVFHRTREFSERPALLEAILAKIGQRTFPSYENTRTNTVFKNRDELLKYEAAIKLHFEMSKLIDSAMGAGRAAVVYVRDGEEPKNIRPNGHRRSHSTRQIKKSAPNSALGDDDDDSSNATVENHEEKDPEQERRRLEVIGIYERVIEEAEGIRDAWRGYIATETEVSKKSPNYFLLRFSPGWVYTQILRLELRAFAFLKRFEEESILLHELLDQQIYSLGQRGGWYERLALIKSNYAFQKRLGKKEALQVCMTALRDKHVHAVDATLIQARIVRLESELKVPFRDRHDFSYLVLRKAQTRILTGERLNTPGTAAPSYASSQAYSYIPGSSSSQGNIIQQRPFWRNIDGSDCTVEELALSYYKTLGYKGYHSENSILSTLFGLLFWDILFSPQPGVFETPFQSAPLDLNTDAFFLQRQEMIIERVEKIAKSRALECPEGLKTAAKAEGCRMRTRLKLGELEEQEEEEELLILRRQNSAAVATQVSAADQEPRNNILFGENTKQERNNKDRDEDDQADVAMHSYQEFLTKKRSECFYLDLIQRHDDLYREKGVYCVGVNWTFSKDELLEIAECIGGMALAEICKVMAQEHSKRSSGMPDLCCWNYDKKLVKFAEVKGPGDRLSSKQKLWIDLLTSLGIDIELCIVQVAKDEDAFLEERKTYN
ncbi:hypothetical protein EDD11_005055 [Mortierella claussenii]|nr:hypothetical protein EDD11_005055 [Mortierella claussenii]